MADALTITDFASYDASKDTSADKIKTDAPKGTTIPSGWLSFYTSLMENVKLYQAALEKQNYADLAKYDVIISQKIAEYLNKNFSSKETKTNLKDIVRKYLKEATDYTIEIVKDKTKKAFEDKSIKSEKEVVDTIETAIFNYKQKIRDILDSAMSSVSSFIEELKKEKDESDKKTVSDFRLAALEVENKAVKESINELNLALRRKEKEYQEKASEFSVTLGNKLLDVFQENIKKITANASRIGNKINNTVSGNNIVKPENVIKTSASIDAAEISSDVSSEKASLEAAEIKKTRVWFSDFTKKKIIPVVKGGLKVAAAWIGAAIWRIGAFFLLNFIRIGKILLKFVFVDFWKILGRFRDRTISILKGIFNVSKKIFNAITKNSFSQILFGFFKTYAGAYALGEIFGLIWWSIKKKLNIETIEEFKTVALEKIKENLQKIHEKVQSIPTPKEIWEEFKTTLLYQTIVKAAKSIKWMYETLHPFLRDYVFPAFSALGHFIAFFAPNVTVSDLRNGMLARAGLMTALRYLKIATGKIRGGIAGLITGAAVVAAAAVNASFKKEEMEQRQKFIDSNSIKEFNTKDVFGKDVVGNGYFVETSGMIDRLLNGNKSEEAYAVANKLIDENDKLQRQFELYNNHVSVLVSNYWDAKAGRLSIGTMTPFPEKLINMLTEGLDKSKIDYVKSLNSSENFLEISSVLMKVLSQKKIILKQKVEDFRSAIDKKEKIEKSFLDGIYSNAIVSTASNQAFSNLESLAADNRDLSFTFDESTRKITYTDEKGKKRTEQYGFWGNASINRKKELEWLQFERQRKTSDVLETIDFSNPQIMSEYIMFLFSRTVTNITNELQKSIIDDFSNSVLSRTRGGGRDAQAMQSLENPKFSRSTAKKLIAMFKDAFISIVEKNRSTELEAVATQVFEKNTEEFKNKVEETSKKVIESSIREVKDRFKNKDEINNVLTELIKDEKSYTEKHFNLKKNFIDNEVKKALNTLDDVIKKIHDLIEEKKNQQKK